MGGGLTLYVEGYSVPSICSPLSQQKIEFAETSYDHLSSLELADSSMGVVELQEERFLLPVYDW